METKAILKGVRLSEQKGRLVADLIRGKKLDQALNILQFTQRSATVHNSSADFANSVSASNCRNRVAFARGVAASSFVA